MKIHYSPYFNGKAYVGQDLLGECVLETAGLLDRLELLCGLTQDDVADEERVSAYLDALLQTDSTGSLYPSLCIDAQERESHPQDPDLKVTVELLRWRDQLILAGWDRVAPLPEGKLQTLAQAEACLPAQSVVRRGRADRWLTLADQLPKLRQAGLDIVVHCPRVLLPLRVASLIEALSGVGAFVSEPGPKEPLRSDGRQVFFVDEPYQAYEWLALQTPQPDTVVVCGQGQRLDAVLRSLAQPEAGETPRVGSHRVVSDLRCQLQAPKRLIWLDCQGGYGLHYAYDFLNATERLHFPSLPSEEQMLQAVHAQLVRLLNQPDEVCLIAARREVGQPLTEHPMVAALTHARENRIQAQELAVGLPMQASPQTELRFQAQATYQLSRGLDHCQDKVMSFSTLDQLIQYPFNYAVESVAKLYEPKQPDHLSRVKGNVAHYIVELMINQDHSINLSRYDELAQTALEFKGRDLLKPENHFELEEFHLTMRESLQVLHQIITDQHLTPIEDEYKIGWEEAVQLPVFGDSKASIDLLLRDDRDGKYVIFDFKYSTHGDTYTDLLALNHSQQFAFYKEIFDRGEVKAMGYYLFPLHTLFVPEGAMGSDHLSGDNIESVSLGDDALPDLLDSMHRSYETRIAQLRQGCIEEAEGMPLADLDYSRQIAQGELLVPLEHAYNDKKKKGTPYAQTHLVLKNQIR